MSFNASRRVLRFMESNGVPTLVYLNLVNLVV